MSRPQDPSNPLRSALSTLRDRIVREKEPQRDWEEHTGTLAGDDYPALDSLTRRKAAPEREREEPSSCGSLEDLVQSGRIREMDAERMGKLFADLLGERAVGLFAKTIERIRGDLASSAPDDRRWALESVRALTALEDFSLVPHGALPLLLDGVGRMLVKEERVELRDSALDITAVLLGLEGARGNLEGVHAHLAWLERTAHARGTEYAGRVLASRSLVTAPLELLFREGRSALQDRVLPFFRFAGEAGARTLTQLLDEERNRQHRNRILELLKLLGPLSIPALKEGLVAGSWHLVRNALNVVGELEDGQTFEYVVPCLEHPDVRVVHAAVRALWKTGGARAERYLLDLLPRSESGIQVELLEGLAWAGSGDAVPAVGALAANGPEAVRIKAVETLGRIKHARAVPVLETQLRRKGRIFKTAEPMPVRLAAARSLLAIGTQEARRILDQVLADEPKGADLEALRRAIG